ncbi:MAG: hypothetical protein Q7U75_07520, partial [Desulfobacterales bacterium]|nr:hypothetical protein [Desulfobacterales bacterium]
VANQANIPPDKLARLVQRLLDETPNDPMLAELHILRACLAIKEGHLTLEEALAEVEAWAA